MRNTLAALVMIAVMAFGTTFANAGIIVAGLADGDPCTDKAANTGIIVAGFTGIIVAGFTGIIVAGATDDGPEVCGIIVAG
ncbi:MAG: hypothetical protein ABI791_06735 [Acidobacteriota bacterium]